MKKSRHIGMRMSQRGISKAVIDMLSTFGICDGNKISLNQKNCQYLSSILMGMKRELDRMAQKGGYTMVSVNDVLITVYRNNSFNEHKAIQSGADKRRFFQAQSDGYYR